MNMELEVGATYRRTLLHDSFGGQRRGGISTPSSESVVLIFTGNTGLQHGYDDRWVDSDLFEYSGEGQIGDMQFIRGNAAVRDHDSNGKSLFLFAYVRKAYVRYVGEMTYSGHHWVRKADRNGDIRDAIVFELVPTTTLNESVEEAVPTHSEVAEAEEAIRFAAGRGGRGQGFGLTKPEKDAVEQWAMSRVEQYFVNDGWNVRDTHRNHSFDFQCSKGSEVIDVEVKGTTGQGAAVVVTFGEVEHMRGVFPNSVLAIVSSILLRRSGTEPSASGGLLRLIRPWEIADENLRPIGYKYSVPPG
jgi:hypothetical protein